MYSNISIKDQSEKLYQSIYHLILVTLIFHYKPPQNNTLSVSLRSFFLSLFLSPYSLYSACVKIVLPYICKWDAIQNFQERHHRTKKSTAIKLRQIGNQKLSRRKSVFWISLERKHKIYHCNVIRGVYDSNLNQKEKKAYVKKTQI